MKYYVVNMLFLLYELKKIVNFCGFNLKADQWSMIKGMNYVPIVPCKILPENCGKRFHKGYVRNLTFATHS
jgi:hypothetical protein